VRDHFN
jgi:linoleoyl-CoA desaturase